VPQQEEKIQRILDIAKRLYGEELPGKVLWGKNTITWDRRNHTPRFVHLRKKNLMKFFLKCCFKLVTGRGEGFQNKYLKNKNMKVLNTLVVTWFSVYPRVHLEIKM